MPCDKDCQQGRLCSCDRSTDRSTVVIVILMLVAIFFMAYGLHSLLTDSPWS